MKRHFIRDFAREVRLHFRKNWQRRKRFLPYWRKINPWSGDFTDRLKLCYEENTNEYLREVYYGVTCNG